MKQTPSTNIDVADLRGKCFNCFTDCEERGSAAFKGFNDFSLEWNGLDIKNSLSYYVFSDKFETAIQSVSIGTMQQEPTLISKYGFRLTDFSGDLCEDDRSRNPNVNSTCGDAICTDCDRDAINEREPSCHLYTDAVIPATVAEMDCQPTNTGFPECTQRDFSINYPHNRSRGACHYYVGEPARMLEKVLYGYVYKVDIELLPCSKDVTVTEERAIYKPVETELGGQVVLDSEGNPILYSVGYEEHIKDQLLDYSNYFTLSESELFTEFPRAEGGRTLRENKNKFSVVVKKVFSDEKQMQAERSLYPHDEAGGQRFSRNYQVTKDTYKDSLVDQEGCIYETKPVDDFTVLVTITTMRTQLGTAQEEGGIVKTVKYHMSPLAPNDDFLAGRWVIEDNEEIYFNDNPALPITMVDANTPTVDASADWLKDRSTDSLDTVVQAIEDFYKNNFSGKRVAGFWGYTGRGITIEGENPYYEFPEPDPHPISTKYTDNQVSMYTGLVSIDELSSSDSVDIALNEIYVGDFSKYDKRSAIRQPLAAVGEPIVSASTPLESVVAWSHWRTQGFTDPDPRTGVQISQIVESDFGGYAFSTYNRFWQASKSEYTQDNTLTCPSRSATLLCDSPAGECHHVGIGSPEAADHYENCPCCCHGDKSSFFFTSGSEYCDCCPDGSCTVDTFLGVPPATDEKRVNGDEMLGHTVAVYPNATSGRSWYDQNSNFWGYGGPSPAFNYQEDTRYMKLRSIDGVKVDVDPANWNFSPPLGWDDPLLPTYNPYWFSCYPWPSAGSKHSDRVCSFGNPAAIPGCGSLTSFNGQRPEAIEDPWNPGAFTYNWGNVTWNFGNEGYWWWAVGFSGAFFGGGSMGYTGDGFGLLGPNAGYFQHYLKGILNANEQVIKGIETIKVLSGATVSVGAPTLKLRKT